MIELLTSSLKGKKNVGLGSDFYQIATQGNMIRLERKQGKVRGENLLYYYLAQREAILSVVKLESKTSRHADKYCNSQLLMFVNSAYL